ncbi:hypothetical protein MRX96_027923 [Rhipicephalus microplus]
MVTLNVPPKVPPPGRAHCREKVHSPGVTGKTAQQGRAASLLQVRRSGEVGSRERTRRGCKLRVAANCRKSLGWGPHRNGRPEQQTARNGSRSDHARAWAKA